MKKPQAITSFLFEVNKYKCANPAEKSGLIHTGTPYLHFVSATSEGTTNEDLIYVLQERLKMLNAQYPHPKNDEAIAKLAEAMKALEDRRADIEANGGKP